MGLRPVSPPQPPTHWDQATFPDKCRFSIPPRSAGYKFPEDAVQHPPTVHTELLPHNGFPSLLTAGIAV